MSSKVSQQILTFIKLSDDALVGEGSCTHDIFEGIGGEDTIPRKDLFGVLKLMVRNNMLIKGSGIDSRGKLAFKWAIHSDGNK